MTARLHEATGADLEALWPAVRATNEFPDRESFCDWAERERWRVRVSDSGDAVLLTRWRSRLNLLAIKYLWCPPRRVPVRLQELRDLGADIGLGYLVSPLLAEEAIRPYLRGGMAVYERLVSLRVAPFEVTRAELPVGVTLHEATPDDVGAIAALEAASFDEFWRHDRDDLERDLAGGRSVVARRDDELVGYTLSRTGRAGMVLGRLAVHPVQRRRGIGRALVADVADHAQRRGVSAIKICTQQTNKASRALYAACGFREHPGELILAVDSTWPGHRVDEGRKR